MNEKQISVGCVAASGLWVAAFGLWIASVVYHARGPASLGIMVAIAAGTATVRCYHVDQARRVRSILAATRAAEESTVSHLR